MNWGRFFAETRETRKHLHARGENYFASLRTLSARETPPRTWRKPNRYELEQKDNGNTSTHVEKTIKVFGIVFDDWKHLHARGENNVSAEYESK